MKMLLFLFAGVLNIAGAMHEFYVGMTEIRYSETTESYQVTLKLFTDDLENAIYKDSGDSLHLENPNELQHADILIFQYLKKHFTLADASDNSLPLIEIGRETELDVTWIYLETQKMKPLDALHITNNIFMEMHPDQTHIVNLIQTGITKSTLLHSAKTADMLKP